MKQLGMGYGLAVLSILLLLPIKSSADELHISSLKAAKLYYIDSPELAKKKESSFQFISGKLLIDAKQLVSVSCTDAEEHELSKIEFNPGTVALLSIDDGIMRLTNLYEPHHESITVSFQQHDTAVSVGEEVCVARDMDKINQLYANEPGSRRLVKSEKPEGGYSMVLMEISLHPPLHNDSIIRSLHTSKSSEERRLFSRLAKMATCLSFARHH